MDAKIDTNQLKAVFFIPIKARRCYIKKQELIKAFICCFIEKNKIKRHFLYYLALYEEVFFNIESQNENSFNFRQI